MRSSRPGPGVIGQYTECSFRLAGKGTFFATDATNPTVGQKGRREDVDEWRLEVVVPERLVAPVVAAMRKAHSYEEPAFDVYPLKPGTGGGEGRVGELASPRHTGRTGGTSRSDELKAASVQVVGDLSRTVRKVGGRVRGGGGISGGFDTIECRCLPDWGNALPRCADGSRRGG